MAVPRGMKRSQRWHRGSWPECWLAFRAVLPLLVCFLVIDPTIVDAQTVQRRALIIGNQDYVGPDGLSQGVPSLTKPAKDVELYEGILTQLGYEVVSGLNLDKYEIIKVLANFLSDTKSGASVVFVYSGHGYSDTEDNYIVPTDFVDDEEPDVRKGHSIGLKYIYDRLSNKGARPAILIIDACRDVGVVNQNGTGVSPDSRPSMIALFP